ncbi:metal-binding protein [Pseudomonas sp. ABAC61]|nr:metal-binding protein [Pseudomonas sp. ABAC61]
MPKERSWTLMGTDGQPFDSDHAGTLGGHRRTKLYGKLDCRAARQAIARGGYVKYRVFFLDEASAILAGYRPCAVCMPVEYEQWKTGGRPQTTPHLDL